MAEFGQERQGLQAGSGAGSGTDAAADSGVRPCLGAGGCQNAPSHKDTGP